MSEYFLLNDDHTVRPVTMHEWAELYAKTGIKRRRVAETNIGDVYVSTIFMGLNHRFGKGPPLIFETMIFGGPLDSEQWRYSTWDDAVIGHEAAVRKTKKAQERLARAFPEFERSKP